MLKWDVAYTDFNDVDRTDTLYFHLNESELIDLEMKYKGGLSVELERLVAEGNNAEALELVKDLIHRSYGRKSDDGKYFHKSESITNDFVNSAMYGTFLLDIFESGSARVASFVTGLMPKKLIDRLNKKLAAEGKTVETFVAEKTAEVAKEELPPVNAQPTVAANHESSNKEREMAEFLAWKASQSGQTS